MSRNPPVNPHFVLLLIMGKQHKVLDLSCEPALFSTIDANLTESVSRG